MIKYIFNENNLLDELRKYIDKTYNEHYASKGKIQVTEFIASHCDSPDFFRGNAIKYAARYGYKEGYNRKDILKALHYLIMFLDWHDKNAEELPSNISYDPFDPNQWKTNKKHRDDKNTIPVGDVTSQNVYVQMSGGKIGQEKDGVVVEVGYGELDEHGCLKPGTFRYSTHGAF